MTPRRRVTPRPALSARQLDRTQALVRRMEVQLSNARYELAKVHFKFRALLASLERSERR